MYGESKIMHLEKYLIALPWRHGRHGASHYSLHWRHNDHDGVSNHQPHDCLLNRLFRRRSKKTSKLRVTGLCVGNWSGTDEFPAQIVSNAENVSIWWRHLESESANEAQTTFWQEGVWTLPSYFFIQQCPHHVYDSNQIKIRSMAWDQGKKSHVDRDLWSY